MPQPAAETARNAAAAVAALLATETPLLVSPADSDERAEQLAAAAACMEAQQARASEETARLTKHRGALHAQLEEQCCKAEARQETVAAAVHALAGRIACLVQSRSGEPSALLGAHLPDGYAAACQTLLDSLAGYLQHNFPTAEPPASKHAAADAQAAMLELEQLQRFQIKAEQLHIQDEAEIARWVARPAPSVSRTCEVDSAAAGFLEGGARKPGDELLAALCPPTLRLPRALLACRLQAELEVLQAQAVTAGAASLGYSTADLRAEAASLERRRDAALHAALAQAEGAAAAAAGAEVVREQAAVRRAILEQRLHAKQQVGWETRSGHGVQACELLGHVPHVWDCYCRGLIAVFLPEPCRWPACWPATWAGSCWCSSWCGMSRRCCGRWRQLRLQHGKMWSWCCGWCRRGTQATEGQGPCDRENKAGNLRMQ